MKRVRLIHWNEAEAEERAGWLEALGYKVDRDPFSRAVMKAMREKPPAAVIIDLGRVPSQGRDVAVGIRTYKDTRGVPLVFVGGPADKAARVRELLPDATYTTWVEISGSLADAIAHPPADPVKPGSAMAGYSGTPLPKKLGIKPGSVLALVGAPEEFESTLGEIPDWAVVQRGLEGQPGVTLWFVRSRSELEQGIEAMGILAEGGGLWIVWPKKASGVKSDLSQNIVRRTGLDSGLVDFRIASVDKTWSGLRFTIRKG